MHVSQVQPEAVELVHGDPSTRATSRPLSGVGTSQRVTGPTTQLASFAAPGLEQRSLRQSPGPSAAHRSIPDHAQRESASRYQLQQRLARRRSESPPAGMPVTHCAKKKSTVPPAYRGGADRRSAASLRIPSQCRTPPGLPAECSCSPSDACWGTILAADNQSHCDPDHISL